MTEPCEAWNLYPPSLAPAPPGRIYGRRARSICRNNIMFGLHGQIPRPALAFTLMPFACGPHTARRPDVTIDCGPRNWKAWMLFNPVLVIEVVPPGISAVTLAHRLLDYGVTKTITHCLLVEFGYPRVFIYDRERAAPQEVTGLAGAVEIPALGVALRMADIYDGLE